MKILTVVLVAFAMVAAVGCKSSTVQGEGGKKLTLEKPGDVKIQQGGMAKLTIKIKRENMDEPVSVSFEKLPKGVSVVDADMKIVGTEGVYNLKADADAALVSDNVVEVTAKAPSGIAVTEMFKITVEPKK